MAKAKVLSMAGKETGTIELSDAIFGIEVNENAVHDYVKNYLANQRQGTQSAKTRSDVSGGGKKPFRQKGTGRHRQGSSVDPSQVGGGVAFAPKPRSYRYSIPKKVKRLALKSVLTSKVKENELIVLDKLEVKEPSTKEMVKTLAAVKAAKKALIVTAECDANVLRSASNIPGVQVSHVGQLNPYEVLVHESLILTKDAVNKIQEVYK